MGNEGPFGKHQGLKDGRKRPLHLLYFLGSITLVIVRGRRAQVLQVLTGFADIPGVYLQRPL